jgi:hypothetical protein
MEHNSVAFPRRLLPIRSGVWALVWKDWIQSWREFNIKNLLTWLVIFGSAVGMMLAPGWGTRIWVFIVWAVVVGQVCSKRFSSDLRIWVLLRSLPFSAKAIIIAEIAHSVIATILVSWVAYGLCRLINLDPSATIVILIPGLVLCVSLAAIFDILRQVKADVLLDGHGFDMGVVGLLIGLLSAGAPLALALVLTNLWSRSLMVMGASISGLGLCLILAYALWQLSAARYKKIK